MSVALQHELAQLNLPHAASPTASRLTVSMGLATQVPGEDQAAAALVAAADTQLYEAKADGRNQYRIAVQELQPLQP